MAEPGTGALVVVGAGAVLEDMETGAVEAI